MLKGNLKIQVFDTLDEDLIYQERGEDKLIDEIETTNTIDDTLRASLRDALLDPTFGWDTNAVGFAMRNYQGGTGDDKWQRDGGVNRYFVSANAQTTSGSVGFWSGQDWDVGGYGQLMMIAENASSAEKAVMKTVIPPDINNTTGVITVYGHINTLNMTVDKGQLGSAWKFTHSGDGTPYWRKKYAETTFDAVTLNWYQTLRITWTISFTG